MREIRALLLAAGIGTRLAPLTNHWPKCLMPISGRPLLEHWLCILKRNNVERVLVNTHYHRSEVEKFLNRERFSGWVSERFEKKLLGTAGTLRENQAFFKREPFLLIHADNWCQCDFDAFLYFHAYERPIHTMMTMMTFRTSFPETCGIVEVDSEDVVQVFHEKVSNPPGNLANGAVYLIEPELLMWLKTCETVSDFSTEVLPNFIGRIATWENTGIHRDIGTICSLLDAQADPTPNLCWLEADHWQKEFETNSIHHTIKAMAQ